MRITHGQKTVLLACVLLGTASVYTLAQFSPPGGSGGGFVWGQGTGTLSSQTDLQTALNGKQATLGFTPENSANKDATSGYAGLDSSGKLKVSTECPTASASVFGCLASADWSTFNGKQAALGFTPLNPANNLSDLGSATTGRVNLGLNVNGALKVTTAGAASQAACGDLSNAAASCSTDTTNASNISSGTLGAGRLPNPSASTIGGVQSIVATLHQWIDSISTSGVPHQSQPACGDLSNAAASCSTDTTNASNISSGTLGAARLPNPSASTLGGVQSITASLHQWIDSISTSGVPHESQPACGDLSNAGPACQGTIIHAFGGSFGSTATGAAALTSSQVAYVTVPYACTIQAWNILATPAGSATIQTWKVATGTALPTSGNSISTSGVSISSGTAVHSTTLTDFTTTTVSANDILGFNLSAVATATYVNFTIQCQ